MLRTLTCTIVALMLAATSALGGMFSDPANTFTFTAPEGWTAETVPDPTIATVIVSPRRPATGGNCNVIIIPFTQTRSMTQAELDAELAGQIDEAFWRAMFSTVKGLKSTKIETFGVKTQRGRKVYYVKATSDADINGVTITVTQLQDIHAIPGRGYAVTCTVLAPAFDREASDFEAIMTSFEPVPDMTVAATPRAPSAFASPAHRAPEVARTAADALGLGLARARGK